MPVLASAVSTRSEAFAANRQAMLDQGKSLVRLHIETWGPVATGGFPARLAGG